MSDPTIRVLFVEDMPTEAELELRELKRAGLSISHKVVDTRDHFIEALHQFAPDIILSDFSMPEFDGMSALGIARERAPETPFIFVSGTIGEEHAIRALKSGATDYVLKTNLKRLPSAVERAIAEARERRVQRRTQLELDLARERLTGIINTLQDMLWSVDARGERVLFASPAALHVFGRPAEVFQNDVRQFAKLAHPDDRPRFELAWTRLLAGASLDIEYRSQWPNGGVRWVNQRARVIRGADGTIERIDGIARDVTEQAEQRQRIRHLALYDQLTGLPNRTLFRDRLIEELQHGALSGPGFALALFDLERFNAINDVFGPEVGNEVLKAMAARLRSVSPQADSVARVGGDLFAVKYFGVSSAAEVEPLIERAWESVFGAPFQVLGQEVRVFAKAGVAMFPRDGADADTLSRNAEAALRHAKQAGERRAFYAPEINAWVAERVSLENRLRTAVDNGELFFQYQPKLELATRRMVGVEALMRWNGPDGKPVSPAKFIPILEQTGLIVEAGRQALAAANATYRGWQARGLRAPRVAVNVSALQLRRQSFIADLRAALADLADDGGGVDVEVTESLLMSDIEQTTRKLNELRAMGLHIALDDFGTGYSSLAYLSRLPIDTLKIDRAFVRGMTEHRTDLSIITSIVSLAQALQIQLVAEGVETAEQAERLLRLGCQQAQGFLFSPPVALERLEPFLQRE
jgi:diguanylate cyclase (GGDEF)-like protein/PAS domain S-box-containing protein